MLAYMKVLLELSNSCALFSQCKTLGSNIIRMSYYLVILIVFHTFTPLRMQKYHFCHKLKFQSLYIC